MFFETELKNNKKPHFMFGTGDIVAMVVGRVYDGDPPPQDKGPTCTFGASRKSE